MKYETFPIPPPAAVYGDIADNGFVWSDDMTILRGYIGGLGLANDATSPGTVIDVGAGICASDDVTAYMALGPFTKTTAAWAAGPGNGGLDAGSVAPSTWYHAFVIQRTDTGAVDVLLSQSATAPALPSPYTRKRRIGSIRTSASSQILAFTQVNDTFVWSAVIAETITATTASSLSTLAGVPPGVVVEAHGRGYLAASGASQTQLLLSNAAESAVTVSGANFNAGSPQASAAFPFAINVRILTNASAQIRSALNTTAGFAALGYETYGWRDFRGQ